MLYTLPKEIDYNPLLPDLPKKGWKYALHVHKNKNGTHYDVGLAPPNQIIAYAWSTKTLPFKNTNVKAYRTRDKLREDLDFDGTFLNRHGYHRKKLLTKDDINDVFVDELGINFTTAEGKFRIENVKGKKYIIRGLDE